MDRETWKRNQPQYVAFGGARGGGDRLYRQVKAAIERQGIDIETITVDEVKKLPPDLRTVVENLGVVIHGTTGNELVTAAIIDEANHFTSVEYMGLPRSAYPGKLSMPNTHPGQLGRPFFSAADWGFESVVVPEPKPMPSLPKPSKDILQRVAIADIEPVDDTDLRATLAVEAETLLGYSVLRREMKLTSPLAATLKELEIEPFSEQSVTNYMGEMTRFATQEARKANAYAYASWVHTSIAGYEKRFPEIAIQKACEIKRALPAAEIFIEELNIYPDPFLVASLGGEKFYIEVWDEPKFEG